MPIDNSLSKNEYKKRWRMINRDQIIEKKKVYYNNNKNIIYYSVDKNTETINNIKNIEHTILKKYPTDKIPAYNLEGQVNTGVLKLFSDSNDKKKNIDVILKISGLWEDNTSYGITYKFLSIF